MRQESRADEPGAVVVATAALGGAVGVLALGVLLRCAMVYAGAVVGGEALQQLAVGGIDMLLALLLVGALVMLRRRVRGVRVLLAWLVPVVGVCASVLGPDWFGVTGAVLVLLAAVLTRLGGAARWF